MGLSGVMIEERMELSLEEYRDLDGFVCLMDIVSILCPEDHRFNPLCPVLCIPMLCGNCNL